MRINQIQTPQNQNMDTFSKLPPESVLNILSFLDLPELAKVCTLSSSFNELAQVAFLWNQLFSRYFPSIQRDTNTHPKKQFRIEYDKKKTTFSLKHESGDTPSEVTSELLEQEIKKVTHLHHLKFDSISLYGFRNIFPYTIRDLCKSNSGIRTLQLEGFDHMSPAILQEVLEGCPELTSFSLTSNELIDDQLMQNLVKLNYLTYFELSGCIKLSDKGKIHLGQLIQKVHSYIIEYF